MRSRPSKTDTAVPKASASSIARLLRPDMAVFPRPDPAPSEFAAKLDANEIPAALPAGAAAELGETLAAVALHRYGDDSASELRAILCGEHGVHADQVCF